jgi:sugar (pentulose or hexulose) kinase
MPVVLGVDLGTTTVTALALDADGGDILSRHTRPNQANLTAPADRARGRSEWDARRILDTTCACLGDVAAELGGRRRALAGLGITGQQHGGLLVGEGPKPLTPLINWQDRRALETHPASGRTYLQEACARLGADAPRRTGCRLAAGFLAVTLFWLKENGGLPRGARACFLMDYFAALLTGQTPVTDATCAGSSGILDVRTGAYDPALIEALGLPRELFPPVRPSGEVLGGLTPAMAEATGLPAGLPVCVGIGDNQASFLGSVAERDGSVLVNVGTGGQVTIYSADFIPLDDPLLETRPFPRGGYLLVFPGLVGGRTYAVLESFYRQVGAQLFGLAEPAALYPEMNRLAAQVPRGADGLRCEPLFTGTRAEPELRARFTGVSAENFTPAHLTRALLEGMARAFRDGYDQIARHRPEPCRRLVGAGNGLRENPVLARAVADEFGLPLRVPAHREEAAYGAALMAAVGTGVRADVAEACLVIQYEADSPQP